MLAGTHQRLNNATELQIFVNNEILEGVQKYIYLGLNVSNNLTWSSYILSLCSKLAQQVGVIRRLSRKLSTELLLNVYNTIIQPHIYYCIPV